MATDTITIEVDAQAAKAFRALSADEQRQMGISFSHQISSVSDGRHRDLIEVMDEISRKAQERGMTPEILKSIWGKDELEGCF